jgi:autotransporter-associated beta strand protein
MSKAAFARIGGDAGLLANNGEKQPKTWCRALWPTLKIRLLVVPPAMISRFYRHQYLVCPHVFRAGFACLVFSAVSAVGQTTNTNTVTNGGLINVGDTQIITNTVASPISAAITNDGSLQFWQTTVLAVSGLISGSGVVTKASGSGNLTLSGSNTFNGKVTISSGRLDATGVSDTVGSGLGLGTEVELGANANLQVNVGAGTTEAGGRGCCDGRHDPQQRDRSLGLHQCELHQRSRRPDCRFEPSRHLWGHQHG